MPLHVTVNGQGREFEGLTQPASLEQVIAQLNLKGDRIAVEHNGAIVQRSQWPVTAVAAGDHLEIVHFVGGGREPRASGGRRPDRERA
jgi:sulfur carrier protein